MPSERTTWPTAGAVTAKAHAEAHLAAQRKTVDLDQAKWQEAICEQAIALLVYGRVARNAGEADAYSLQAQTESNTADTPDIPMMGGFSVEALRACGWTGNIAMRG